MRRVSAINGPHRTQHLAGAGNSKRPFARSQRRFRHHCEVNVPGLPLRFHAEYLPKPVRSRTPSLRSVSKPIRGEFYIRYPLSAPILRRSRDSIPISTPLQVLFENPPDQSVQPVPSQEARLTERPIAFCSPRLVFRFRFGSLLETRFVPPGSSFRKPWTESIMHSKGHLSPSIETGGFSRLSSSFFRLYFSITSGRSMVDSLCINQRFCDLFPLELGELLNG